MYWYDSEHHKPCSDAIFYSLSRQHTRVRYYIENEPCSFCLDSLPQHVDVWTPIDSDDDQRILYQHIKIDSSYTKADAGLRRSIVL